MTLAPAYIAAANAMESNDAWLILVDITLSDGTEFHVLANTEDVTWRGLTYQAFPVSISDHTIKSTGENQQLTLTVLNPNGEMTLPVRAAGGGEGAVVAINWVYSALLDQDEPAQSVELECISSYVEEGNEGAAAVFTLGDEIFFERPAAPLMYAFQCSYTSDDECPRNHECDHNYSDCVAWEEAGDTNRTQWFGGTPGLSKTGYVI